MGYGDSFVDEGWFDKNDDLPTDEEILEELRLRDLADRDFSDVMRSLKCIPHCLNGNYRCSVK